MKKILRYIVFCVVLFSVQSFLGQNVTLFNQFNGHYDFTFIGNSMNTQENNSIQAPVTLTTSTANLNLDSNFIIEKAYLYWAGSGDGDFNVNLNTTPITPDRTFSWVRDFDGITFTYFSAFKDVTNLIQSTGNGDYSLSDLDISTFEPLHLTRRTNFAGWAIVIVYREDTLPINQINVYDGLQGVPDDLAITLNSINVIDSIDAKVGFVAWEGDSLLATEEFRINGNLLSNTLNPVDNVFNSTSTITNSTILNNMDLDIYDIQNNIQVGDISAQITLTSFQDFVMINTVVTKLNSEVPDATIEIAEPLQICNSRTLNVNYTVNNFNCFHFLPANTPIAIYANTILVGQTFTQNDIPIDGSENGQTTISIPNTIPNDFTLSFVVDDNGLGTGIISELNENNNSYSQPISLWLSPLYNNLPNLFSCVDSLTNVSFDFSNYSSTVIVNPTDTVQFFTTLQDANDSSNAINNISNYVVNTSSTTIYVRIDNSHCYSITQFKIDLILYPAFNLLPDLNICKQNESTRFDFTENKALVNVTASNSVQFYETLQNTQNDSNPITNITSYLPTTTPKIIYVRIDNGFCYSTTFFTIDYYELPKLNLLDKMISCNEGLKQGTFNLTPYETAVKVLTTDTFVGFYTSLEDAQTANNSILNTTNFNAYRTPKEIFIRVENEHCYDLTSFIIETKNCPPEIFNFFSPNNDTYNDTFEILGLRDIFLNFELEIYNRWGIMIWKGNNNTPDWDGHSNKGLRLDNKESSSGVYYYILKLNDAGYPNPFVGWIYLAVQ